jgi:hypothetical protein
LLAIPHGAFKLKVAFCVTAVFTPVLAKHIKSFKLVDTLSVGVDRIQRNFEPMQRQELTLPWCGNSAARISPFLFVTGNHFSTLSRRR